MRKFLVAAAAGAAAFMAVPANAATFIMANAAPGGLITWVYGNNDVSGSIFTDVFTFNTVQSGTLSLSLSEAAQSAVNNIEFTEVLLNGTAVNLFSGVFPNFVAGGASEPDFGSLLNLATTAGQNTLSVKGTNGGNGVYSGTLAFSPSTAPVPEPATWAMMLFGFGGVGFAMRRRKGENATKRMRFANA